MAQFSPEDGSMLMPGDPGYSDYQGALDALTITERGQLADLDASVDAELAALPADLRAEHLAARGEVRKSAALDTIQAKEALRLGRLVATSKGEAIPSPIDAGYRAPGDRSYAPDGPREATRLAAIAAWGTTPGPFEPMSGLDALAVRREREELETVARREHALHVLRRSTEASRARAADPGTRRPYFEFNG